MLFFWFLFANKRNRQLLLLHIGNSFIGQVWAELLKSPLSNFIVQDFFIITGYLICFLKADEAGCCLLGKLAGKGRGHGLSPPPGL